MLSGLGSGETCCYWNWTWTWEDWWISEHKCVDHNGRWLCKEIDTTQSWIAKCVICSRVESAYCIGPVKFSRIDISVDVAMLLRFLAVPRRGHADCAFYVFADLKWYNHLSMDFDEAELTLTYLWLCDWSEYDTGVCNAAAVSPDAPDVRSNWFWWIAMLTQIKWVGVVQGWIKPKICFMLSWIWVHGCKGCSFVK